MPQPRRRPLPDVGSSMNTMEGLATCRTVQGLTQTLPSCYELWSWHFCTRQPNAGLCTPTVCVPDTVQHVTVQGDAAAASTAHSNTAADNHSTVHGCAPAQPQWSDAFSAPR